MTNISWKQQIVASNCKLIGYKNIVFFQCTTTHLLPTPSPPSFKLLQRFLTCTTNDKEQKDEEEGELPPL